MLQQQPSVAIQLPTFNNFMIQIQYTVYARLFFQNSLLKAKKPPNDQGE